MKKIILFVFCLALGIKVIPQDSQSTLITTANTKINEVDSLIATGDYNKVPLLIDQILSITDAIEDVETRFLVYSISINKYIAAKLYPKAIELSLSSLSKAQNNYGSRHVIVADFLAVLALSYAYDNQIQNAIKYGRKSVEMQEELGEYGLLYIKSIVQLTSFYNENEQYPESIKTLKQSLCVIDTSKVSPPQLAIIYRSLSQNYETLYNYSQAIEYAEKALEIYDGTPLNYLSLKGHLAYLYSQANNSEKALQIIDEVCEEAERNNLGELYVDATIQKANILLDSKDENRYVLALKLAELCTRYYEAKNDKSDKFINSLQTLASAYGELGFTSKRQEIYTKIYNIVNQNGNDLEGLAFTSFMSGKYNESLSYFKEIANRVAHQKGEKCYEYADVELRIAELSFALGNVNDAAKYFEDAFPIIRNEIINSFYLLKDKERKYFWDKFNHYFNEVMPRTCYNADNPDIATVMYDMTLLSKGILLNTEIAMRDIDAKKSSAQLLGKILDVKWEDVRKRLGPNDIAIEFIQFFPVDSFSIYMALSIRKNSEHPIIHKLFTGDQLKNVSENYSKASKDLIWGSFGDALEGVKNIYFSPAGSLHNIGIEYLPGMEGFNLYRLSSTRELVANRGKLGTGKNAVLYGGLDYNASIDSLNKKKSQTVLNYTFKEHADVRGLGLRGGKEPLEHTKIEVDKIGEELNKAKWVCLLDTASLGTEESFKSLSGRKINCLHISTHGFYYTKEEADNAQYKFMLLDDQIATTAEDKALTRSGLILSGANHILEGDTLPDNVEDGILTAKEIANVDLRGLDLVVLSACQTGLGDISQGEGVFGLQRAFKKAGANTILMSLWEVNDEATQILMTQFYKNLVAGMSKRESLQSAQKYLRMYKNEKGEQCYNEPKYWAAFIMLDSI